MGGHSLFLHVCVFLCTWASTGAPPHSHTQKLSVRSFFWKQRRKPPCFVIGSKKCPAEWIKEIPPRHIGNKNRDAHTKSNTRKRSKGNFKFQYFYYISSRRCVNVNDPQIQVETCGVTGARVVTTLLTTHRGDWNSWRRNPWFDACCA